MANTETQALVAKLRELAEMDGLMQLVAVRQARGTAEDVAITVDALADVLEANDPD